MLAGRTETRELPHEPGQTITFRTLSGRELDEAEEVISRRVMDMVKDMDMSKVQTQADVQKEESKDSYDKDTLVKYGVKEWSDPEPCTLENKRRLDAETWNWAVKVILEMNVRPSGESKGSDENYAVTNSHRSSSEPVASQG